MLNLGVDAHVVNSHAQGSRTYLLELYRKVLESNPDLPVTFVLDQGAPIPSGWSFPQARFRNWNGKISRGFWQASWHVLRERLTAFHFNYIVPTSWVPNALVTIHDILPDSHPEFFSTRFVLRSRALYRLSANRAAHVFTVSEYTRQQIIERYRINEERISVTPNGVDLSRFNPSATARRCQLPDELQTQEFIVVVGRFDRRKNHLGILRAYKNLLARRSLPMLVFVGSDAGFGAAVQDEILRLKLQAHVVILRDLPDSALPVIYACAHASISASFAEGFCIPLVEAMASGCPTACARNTAQVEVAEGAAILFEDNEQDSFEQALEAVIFSETSRAQLRQSGLERAARYQWTEAAKEVVRVTKQLG